MKGANEYANLIQTCQIGRLYMVSGYHARGNTFEIYVLPEGEKVIPNGQHNPPLNSDAVKVYGPISGQLGWSEEYGWIHEGRWQDDFEKICELKRAEKESSAKASKLRKKMRNKEKEDKIDKMLSSY